MHNARTTVAGAWTICGFVSATDPAKPPECWPAAPVNTVSPNARALLCTAAKSPRTKRWRFCTISKEDCGVRQTSRLVGVNKDTVVRLAVVAGQHAQQVHDEQVTLSPQTREVPIDEKWAFMGKKEKHCAPDEPADAH